MSRPDAPFINNAMKLKNRLLLSVLVVTSLVSGCDSFQRAGSGLQKIYDAQILETTINIRLQAVADSLLRKALAGMEHLESACIVVQNIMTGEIPVIVNLGRNSENELSEDYNYAVRKYEPGEVLSPASWMVALDDGMAYSHADLSDAIASGKLSRVYEMVPDHYARTLKSFRIIMTGLA